MPITPSNVYFQPPESFSEQPAKRAQLVAMVIADAPENARSAIVTIGSPENKWPPLTVDWYGSEHEHLNRRRLA
ncbi:hypothetical protein L211DRAFT_843200 [Terfezia boudieri ATCC MYA-4762]|uniref:Uncharacterized protein n=1 Tax=Terfezia boudieri ATCC MYA-4762 TaxID=1051890 RepID=A0A3N4L7E6_9PEZI|nr:hypothetical protein L211DRAFT_843200 [Terfezia boudieri ATCC MYA-4762]